MRKENGEKGFTLAELMITVAIIGVLAAVSFIAVAGHQKKLRLLEMDNTAREIFNAAQNHLTQSKSNGLWDKLVDDADAAGTYDESQWGIPLAAKPSDGVTEASGTHSYRRIIVSNGSCISDKGSGVFKLILPYGSVDDTVNHGSYTIEYDINTAQIYSVFYTDTVTSPEMTSRDIDTIYSNISDADYRKSYKMGGSAKGVPVGYYGGATVAEQPSAPTETAVKELQPIKAEIKNGSRLLLCITDPNKDFKDKYFTVYIHGKKSGADATYTLTDKDKIDEQPYLDNAGTVYTYILDSAVIESSAVAENALSRHFSRFGFDAGTDVYAEVTLSLKDDSQKVSSTSNTENSLFEKYDAAKGTAQIANARHLENVSFEISKAEVKNAVLNADISWSADYNKDKIAAKGFYTELFEEDKSYHIYVGTTQPSEPIKHIVVLADGSKASTSKYVGIASTSLHTFDGRGHTVANLPITSSKGTLSSSNAGLISDVSWTSADSDKTLTISNLKLVNADIKDTDSGDNGILLGSFDGGGQSSSLTIKKVDITDPVVTVTGSANAAGLLGHSGQGAVKISNSSIIITGAGASDSGVLAQTGNAGGFIGYIDNASNNKITLTNNSITDTTSKENNKQTAKFYVTTKGTAGNAGGIIGSAVSTGKDIAISMCSASAGTITISAGGDAGGAIGKADVKSVKIITTGINGGATGTITGGINGGATGTITGGSHQGGLAGSLSSTGTTDVEDSFASLLVTTDTGDATGGLIGLVSGAGSAVITRCYAAGRTTAGAYATDIGNVSSKLSTGGSVGGLVGVIQSVSSCSIADSYTTCSVSSASANAASGIGGLLGASTAPVSISNSYTTALVITGSAKAGRFVGICSNTITAAKTNYYLSGINDTVKAVSGDGNNENVATKAYSATTGSPFSVDEGTRKPALPYDTKLDTTYLYMTISQLNSLSASPATLTAAQLVTDNSHVGDWTTGKAEGTKLEKQFAILYYEIVQHASSPVGKNLGYYYHGYEANPQVKVNGTYPEGQYDFKEVYSDDIPSSIPNNGKGLVTGHGEYVAESGYIICVKSVLDMSKIGVDMGWTIATLTSLIETSPEGKTESEKNVLVPYDSFPSGFGVEGYKIYRVNEFNANVQNQASCRKYNLNFTTSYSPNDINIWNNKAAFTLNPYLSDMLYPGEHTYGNVLGLRSAVQFRTQFGLIKSASYVGGWQDIDKQTRLEQQLDISFSEKDVQQTLYNKPVSDDAYISPTLDQIRGGFSSKDYSGTPYVLKHITKQLITTVNGGTVNHLHISDVDVEDMKPLIEDDQGSVSDIIIDKACSPIFGSTNGTKTIDNITVGTFDITRNCPNGLLIQDSGNSVLSNITIGSVQLGSGITIGQAGQPSGVLISNFKSGPTATNLSIGSVNDSEDTKYIGTDCGLIAYAGEATIKNFAVLKCTLHGDISKVSESFGLIGKSNQSTVSNENGNGYFNNILFDVKASEALNNGVGIIGWNVASSFNGYNLNNIWLSAKGSSGASIIGTSSGSQGATNISVTNCVTDGDGFIGTLTGGVEIKKCSIVNAQIAKNGFAGNLFNASTIKNCSIINAQIANNGFVGTMSGYGSTISGCHIYSDPSLYSDTGYYRPNVNSQDTTVSTGDRYNMVTVGLAENANPLTTAGTGSYGGFVGSTTGGTISDCSFTGKVYGENASGFVDSASGSFKISNCYVNAIVTATDAGGAAAGFVRQATGDIYNNVIDKCHSVGMIISKGTAGTGAGFAGGGSSNSVIKNCYSAMWSATTGATYYGFSPSLCGSGNYYLVPDSSGFTDTVSGATGKSRSELELLVSDANIGITGTTKDKTPTVKYGQYNTDTADTKYPYPVPDQSYYYYGDWK